MMSIKKKNFPFFSWKCHNSLEIDEPHNEAERHETYRAVITLEESSGFIIITQSTSNCSPFLKVYENSCHCTPCENFPQFRFTAAKH